MPGLLDNPDLRQLLLTQSLLGVGGGLLANNQGPTRGQALRNAFGGGIQGGMQGFGNAIASYGALQKQADEQKRQEAIKKWAMTLPPEQQAAALANPAAASQFYLKSVFDQGSPLTPLGKLNEDFKKGRITKAQYDARSKSMIEGSDAKYGNNPTYLIDDQGNYHLAQTSDRGGLKVLETPNGMHVVPNQLHWIDTNDAQIGYDRAGVQRAVVKKGYAPISTFDAKGNRVVRMPGEAAPPVPSAQSYIPKQAPAAIPSLDLNNPQGPQPAPAPSPVPSPVPVPAPSPVPAPAAAAPSPNVKVTELPPPKSIEDAKKNVSTIIGRMINSYQNLEAGGGAVKPGEGVMANIGHKLMSTGPGIALGELTGQPLAQYRRSIADGIPLLLQTVRQAQGAGVRSLDTPQEIKFYSSALGGPGQNIYSTLAAMELIDQNYGLGLSLKNSLSPADYKRVLTEAGVMRKQAKAASEGTSSSGKSNLPDPLGIR